MSKTRASFSEHEKKSPGMTTLVKPKNRERRFVSFSGMDGAGKSTQIHNLRGRLTAGGLSVAIVTFWDDVARLTQLREVSGHTLFKGDKGVGSPDAPINRRDKNVRSWPMTMVRYFLYFVDALSLRLAVKKVLKSDVDFIIFDRYAYDELANLTLSNPVARLYVRFIMKLVPRPHVSYLLDADPIQARARKPEYPIEFLYFCRASYLTLNDLIGGMTIIPPMHVEDVQREVWRHVLKQVPPAWQQRDLLEELVGEGIGGNNRSN
jgi:thymidylate kinase